MIKAVIISIVAVASLAACYGPFVQVVRMNGSTEKRLADEVPILENANLDALGFIPTEKVVAVSCQNKIWEPPANSDNALAQLRYKASLTGGNAVAHVLCEPEEGTDLRKNCWASVTCRGLAGRVPAKSPTES